MIDRATLENALAVLASARPDDDGTGTGVIARLDTIIRRDAEILVLLATAANDATKEIA